MSDDRPEPEPQTEPEREALTRMCPSCFAHEGSWCCTQAHRGHYVARLHPERFGGSR